MEGGGVNSPAPPPWTTYPCFWPWAKGPKGGVGKIFHPEKNQNCFVPPYLSNSHLNHMKITCLKNVKYFFDFLKRNVFTRDMRDFNVADQGKMYQTKCRKCPNSEWSFQFWLFNPGWQKKSFQTKGHNKSEAWWIENLIFTQGGFGEGLLDGEIPLPSPESGLPGQVIQDPEFEHSSQQGVSVDI